MRGESEHAAAVVLLRVGARPWQQYSELLEARGSAITVLDSETIEREHGQERLFDEPGSSATGDLLAAAAADIARWRTRGISLITVLDDAYPENLRSVHDRPPLIFVAGRI